MAWNSGKSVQVEEVVDCSAKGVMFEVVDLLYSELNLLLFALIERDIRSDSRFREADVARSRLGGSGSSLR